MLNSTVNPVEFGFDESQELVTLTLYIYVCFYVSFNFLLVTSPTVLSKMLALALTLKP